MPGCDGNPCSAAPEAPPGTTLAEEELTRAGRRSPGSLLALRVVSVPGPHSTSSTFGTDANRRWREVHDATEQRIVLRTNLRAEQRIRVPEKRGVDLDPVVGDEIFLGQRQQLLFLDVHVSPMERCVGFHGRAEVREFRRAAGVIARQRLLQRTNLLGSRPMLRLQP